VVGLVDLFMLLDWLVIFVCVITTGTMAQESVTIPTALSFFYFENLSNT
jgi:hypothetical protein